MIGTITTIIRRDGKGGGYFFIRDSEDRDRFAHARDLRGTSFINLREGLKVEFSPVSRQGGKGNGLAAEKVRVIA